MALRLPVLRPVLLLLVASILSLGAILGVLRLHADARVDLLVDPNTSAAQDQARFADSFGADPVVVMAQPAGGASLLTPDHMVGLSHLEGKLHLAPGVRKVYGPGTLVNTLAISTTTVLLNACGQEGKSAEAAARAANAGKSQAQQDQAGRQAFPRSVCPRSTTRPSSAACCSSPTASRSAPSGTGHWPTCPIRSSPFGWIGMRHSTTFETSPGSSTPPPRAA